MKKIKNLRVESFFAHFIHIFKSTFVSPIKAAQHNFGFLGQKINIVYSISLPLFVAGFQLNLFMRVSKRILKPSSEFRFLFFIVFRLAPPVEPLLYFPAAFY